MSISHDAIADDQTQARAFPDAFRRKKGLKQMGANVLWDAWSVVVDLDEQLMILAPGAESNFSLSIHRIDGIVDEIRPHLVQLVSVCRNLRKRPIILSDQPDPF